MPSILKTGIPLGSTLVPILPLIYINDLSSAANFMIRLFADDICLTLSRNNNEILNCEANIEPNKVIEWMNGNKLSLNFTKAKYMSFEPYGNKLCDKFYFKRQNKNSIKIKC